jgi:phosphoglycolate phosphatase
MPAQEKNFCRSSEAAEPSFPLTMSKFDAILFDLDGTLADTRADLAAALNASLLKFGREPLSVTAVTALIGDGARPLLRKALSRADEETLEEALGFFLAHYLDHCVEKTALYPGVAETLPRLGVAALGVVTNKPLPPTEAILKALKIRPLFKVVLGGDSLPVRKPSPEPLLEAVRQLGTSPGRTLMVGDSAVDVVAARAAGMASCVVTYGYRSEEELKAASPDFTIKAFPDLQGLLH